MSWVGEDEPRRRVGGPALSAVLLLAIATGAVLALAGLARPDETTGEAETAGVAGASAAGPGTSDPQALSLLRRAAREARNRSWTGSQVVSSTGSGAMTAQVQVQHRALTGSTLIVSTGGTAATRTVYETDDDDLGNSPLAAPYDIGAGARWESLVEASYAVRLAGTGTVAGEVTDVVTLTRPGGTVAARIDIGRGSGLPLQRRVYDANGTLARQSVFTSIALVDPAQLAPARPSPTTPRAAVPVPAPLEEADEPNGPPSPRTPAPSLPPALPTPPELPTAAATAPAPEADAVDVVGQQALRAQGYALPTVLGPGLSLVDVRDATIAGAADIDLTYSDGLLARAVHEQRGRLDPAALGSGFTTATRGGASVLVSAGGTRVSWADEGIVYTLVGDVSDDVVDAVVAGLPHRTPAMAFTRRLRRGADRVGSWLDPFH